MPGVGPAPPSPPDGGHTALSGPAEPEGGTPSDPRAGPRPGEWPRCKERSPPLTHRGPCPPRPLPALPAAAQASHGVTRGPRSTWASTQDAPRLGVVHFTVPPLLVTQP